MSKRTAIFIFLLAAAAIACAQIPDGARQADDTHHIGTPPMPGGHSTTLDCYSGTCHPNAHNHLYQDEDVPADCLLCHGLAMGHGGIGSGPNRPAGHPSTGCKDCHTDEHAQSHSINDCTGCHAPFPGNAPSRPEDHYDSGCLNEGCHKGVHLGVWSGTSSCLTCHSSGGDDD